MRLRSSLVPLLAFAAVTALAYVAPPAPPGPHPDADALAQAFAADSARAYQNLQVLPDTTTRASLQPLMESFTEALGVRCTYCHVRNEGEFDFASDAKEHKQVARGMLRMTMVINRGALPASGVEVGDGLAVTCWTCHRGATHPATAPDSTTHD